MTNRPASDPAAFPRWGALCASGIAALCFAVGLTAIEILPIGPLTRHMGGHILMMNAVAPLLALAAIAAGNRFAASGTALTLASLAQLALLWGWHLPAALAVTAHAPALHVLMQFTLFAAALWFWMAIFSGVSRWGAMLALLVTGKLFCLLGVLLVFAPRPLYQSLAAHCMTASALCEGLPDQHLAGLLMLVACPLTYLLAGVVIAARWLREVGDSRAPSNIAAA